jgi:hypothetical protein
MLWVTRVHPVGKFRFDYGTEANVLQRLGGQSFADSLALPSQMGNTNIGIEEVHDFSPDPMVSASRLAEGARTFHQ